MKELLADLVGTPGVSGGEDAVRNVVREHVADVADDLHVDETGNLIARKGDGDTTLMLVAHLDQIGLSVERIDDDGFVHFSVVGGVTLQSLMNQRVTIHGEEDVTGVIGMKPPHLMAEDKRDALPETDQLFIDVGAEDRDDLADDVSVGDYITFDRDFAELRNGYVTGPALDNRAGVAVAIHALEEFDEDYELVAVFSAVEETGDRGAAATARRIDPDVALAVDTTPAGDVPGIEPNESGTETGKGVEITLFREDGRLITPERVKRWLLETGEAYGHDHQPAVWTGAAADTAGIYLVSTGIPTGSIGIPTRHIHSATEVVDIADMEQVVDYLDSVFGTLPDYF